MATTPPGENPMTSSAREYDDLTVITGIKLKTQRLLREQFNVRTYRDLANLSPAEIARLKTKLIPPLRRYVDGWIAKARELAAAAGEGEWKSFGSFVVVFQARKVEGRAEEQRTMVHHREADNGYEWSGIEGEQPWRWMRDQVGEKVQQEPEEEPSVEARPAAAAPPIAAPPLKVEVTRICAFQPPDAETPTAVSEAGQPFSGFVRSGKPFALEVSFELAGPAVAEVAKKQVTYRARFYARNWSTGERLHLGDTKPDTLIKGKSSYTATLPKTALQPGLYHLRVLTTLQGVRTAPGYLELPLLQVV
jgi:hypothetical protein